MAIFLFFFFLVLGEDFLKYMDHFKPFLVAGLRNHAEHQVCQAAVGIVADLCRSLESKILPYVDELMLLCSEILTVYIHLTSKFRGIFCDLISIAGCVDG